MNPPTNSFTLMCVLSLRDRTAQKTTITGEISNLYHNVSVNHSLILPKTKSSTFSSSTKITMETWKLRTGSKNLDGGWKVRNPLEKKGERGGPWQVSTHPLILFLPLWATGERGNRKKRGLRRTSGQALGWTMPILTHFDLWGSSF